MQKHVFEMDLIQTDVDLLINSELKNLRERDGLVVEIESLFINSSLLKKIILIKLTLVHRVVLDFQCDVVYDTLVIC